MSSPKPSLTRTIDRYLQAAAARGSSHRTILGYGTVLRRSLLPWCDEQGIATLADLDQDAVERFAIHLQQRTPPLARETQRTYLKPVRQLLAWGREQGLAGDARPSLPSHQRVRRDVLTRDEIDILESAGQSERDRLIVRIMGDLGAREGEVAALRTHDLIRRGKTWFLRLHGKTGEREAPVSDQLAGRLRMFIDHTRPRADTDALFLTLKRRPHSMSYAGLTAGGVYQAFKDVAAGARLGRRVYPHLLRHSALTHMVARGMHPAMISEMTGVSAAVIATTYTHPSREQMAAAALRLWTEER